MDRLSANPSNSGIFGQPSSQSTDYGGPLSIVNQLKNREMNDFKNKALFMSDLSLKQDRLRRLFDTQDQNLLRPQNQDPRTMDTVMAADPNAMTGYQKADIGVRQQGNVLESQRLTQAGKMGQEALDIKSRQELLNQQKSDQINTIKQADMERKINDSNAKIEQAQRALEQRSSTASQQLKFRKDMSEAIEERHKLEMAMKEMQFGVTSKQHQDQIDAMQKRLDLAGESTTTTEINPEGTKRTSTTKRGSNTNTVKVKGKDGQTYEIPANKVDDWNASHAP